MTTPRDRQQGGRRQATRRILGPAAVAASALLATLLILGRTAAQDPSTAPAQPPQTQPLLPPEAFEPPYPGQFGPKPAEFSDEQWDALRKALDGSEGANEEAFYILLEKVQVPDLDLNDARKVSYEQLMADPKRYRARPVRMVLQKVERKKDRQDEDAKGTPTARPSRIPSVFVTNGFTLDPYKKPQIVVVVSRFEPERMGPNRHFQAVGYFYKVQRFNDPQGGPDFDVPVIIAHQITVGSGDKGWAIDTKMFVTVGLVVLLAVMWLVIRFGLARRGSRAESGYRPRRFELTESQIEQSKVNLEAEEPPADRPEDGQPPAPSRPTDDPSSPQGPRP